MAAELAALKGTPTDEDLKVLAAMEDGKALKGGGGSAAGKGRG